MKFSPHNLATLVTLAAVTFLPLVLLAPVQAERPNFVFVLVDDLGSQDLGYAGSTFYESPNIDALAASGMRFNQGYAACRVCSPSRASIMTGKATVRHGITDFIGAKTGMAWNRDDMVLPAEYVKHLPHEDITIAEAMRDAGYKTFFAGKWHLGGEGSLPTDHGFEINKGGYSSGSPRGGYFSPFKNPNLDNGPAGQSLTMRLAEETASFIESNQDKPFFAFLSFYAVHSPIQTTEQLCRKYQQKAKDMGLTDAEKRFKFDRRLPVRQVQDNPIYAGLVETMDSAVGVVLDKLKETGLDKNTVVIFTSDNGGVTAGDNYSTSLFPLRGGKGRQWEGGTREPFLVHVPGMTSTDSQSEVPVIGMDFYPTILELAGLPLKPEQHVDGVSLVPLLKGEPIAERDLFWHYPHYGNQGGEPSSVIRSGQWKLIYYHEDQRSELYNLTSDIGEQNDVVAMQPERASKMRQTLNAWLTKSGAKFPDPDPRFTQAKFDAKMEKVRTKFTEKLERQHATFLKPSYSPKSKSDMAWWGSAEALSPMVGGFQGEYELAWSDEFDGTEVDKTKWRFQTGDHGWGNAEWQNYTDGPNSTVSDGTLKITAAKTGPGQKAGDYTSSRIKSKQSFTYGKMEIRAKMPDYKGKGLWPALWMLGDSIKTTGWPDCGELDILEYVSYQENTVHCAIHCKAHNHIDKTQREKHVKLDSAEEEFHVYGLQWTEDKLVFYTDDVANVKLTYDRPEDFNADNWPFDKPQHFLLNIAVGGGWGGVEGVEDDKIFPAVMEVDYVRVYQKKAAGADK